jgi:putative transposase
MARRARGLEGNVVYHVYNRRNEKQCLFTSDAHYTEFLELLKTAKERYALRLHAYCLMSTHWHLAVSAEAPASISKSLAWVTTKHAMSFRSDTSTIGLGHVYQNRYCSVAVDGVVHYVRLIRYIEANPVESKLVSRAEDWRWSSLQQRPRTPNMLDEGPWRLPNDWLSVVNVPDIKIELLPGLLGQQATFRPAPI